MFSLQIKHCQNKQKNSVFIKCIQTSGQDGVTGEHGLPPHTTTAKMTTELQNNYHSKSSEKLCGSPTTKQLKKSHLFRRRTGRDEEWGVLHPCVVDKNWKQYLGSKGSQLHTESPSPEFQCQEDKST